MKQLLNEPLVHFLVIGALLFGLFGLAPQPAGDETKRILVGADDAQRLSARFSRTWMRPPTRAELDGLIDGFVRDEIYYREALALGLDRDDPLVRQRMRQKLELLLEDLSDTTEPSDAELERFLAEHAERFALPRKMTLRWRLFLPGFEVHSKPMKAVKLPGWLCASAASVMRDQAVR